ncbi:MAG: hypothetical protein K8T91_25360 [Planctomycetes bacterium]|nr:hypothetical protein [Planctomycetota bacterium]
MKRHCWASQQWHPTGLLSLVVLLTATATHAAEPAAPDYKHGAYAMFEKYCIGCHNSDDHEGKLNLESFESMQQGGKSGPAFIAGDSQSSRIYRVLAGLAKPAMPPEDNPRPNQAEIGALKSWIDSGAQGPSGAATQPTLVVPQIPSAKNLKQPITSIAHSPDGKLLAVGRYGEVEFLDARQLKPLRKLEGLPGKVTSIRFSTDGARLLAASGVAGLYGEVHVWSVADGRRVAKLRGHRDMVYAVATTTDGKLIATAGYDRDIILWDAATGKEIRRLTGHNDPIYDLAFSPDGQNLVSASGDATLKLWRVESGERLDTFGQPLKEQYCCLFTPDGRFVLGAGIDNRVRVWQIISSDKPAINPMVTARFAHEAPIVRLALSRDGTRLATASEDRTVKLWDTSDYRPLKVFAKQPDVVSAVDFAPSGSMLAVARMDGSLELLAITPVGLATKESPAENLAAAEVSSSGVNVPPADEKATETEESEPNDDAAKSNKLSLPAVARGVIQAMRQGQRADADLYRFEAKRGESWIIEVRAARDKSPLDSRVEVLDKAGKPILRLNLRAIRDSYFQFRSRDSRGDDDYRLHNSQEMRIGDYLYANGEVVRLHTYPQGPDSGFWVYPNIDERRFACFDTTPATHGLGEPCYIVEPHAPSETLTPNGLPVFPVYFENDDDARQQLGADSRLTFTAPADGTYLVRVTDVRGFQGDKYRYQLAIRRPRPDFSVQLLDKKIEISPGTGQKFQFKIERTDNFKDEVRLNITNLPPGFTSTLPTTIEREQYFAAAILEADSNVKAPDKSTLEKIRITATAKIAGREVTREVKGPTEIKLTKSAPLITWITPATDKKREGTASLDPRQSVELTIAPGQTIAAQIHVKRQAYKGAVTFGRMGAGFNLPYGVYVDNLGLNGIFVPEDADERTVYITADESVPEQTRVFYLRAQQGGNPTTQAVTLHVRRKQAEIAQGAARP